MIEMRIRKGCITYPTNKKYMNVKCKKHGIRIQFSDKMDNSSIVYQVDRFLQRGLSFPKRIREAYDIPEEYQVPQNEKETFFIPAEAKAKIKPLITNDFALYEFDKENVVSSKAVQVSYYKVPFPYYKDETLKVEICYGDRNFATVSLAKKNENIPTYEQIKKEYGNHLYKYPYKKMTFLTSVKKGALIMPSIFFREWNHFSGTFDVDRFEMQDGSYVIAPKERLCFIDGENIDPKTEAIKTEKVCSSCSENNDLEDIINLIKDIGVAVAEVKEQSFSLSEKVKELENIIKTPQ